MQLRCKTERGRYTPCGAFTVAAGALELGVSVGDFGLDEREHAVEVFECQRAGTGPRQRHEPGEAQHLGPDAEEHAAHARTHARTHP